MTENMRWMVGCAAAIAVLGAGPLTGEGQTAAPPSDPTQVRPLLVSATVPDVPLLGTDGEPTTLYAALGEQPTLVVFFRGGW